TKHALCGYTQQLRLEHEASGLNVLLVLPGPIARETPRTYGAEQAGNLPSSAAQPGAGAKVSAIQPAWLPERSLQACQRRQAELVVPGRVRLLFALAQLSPSLGDWLIKRFT